jgi:hypothetical protein
MAYDNEGRGVLFVNDRKANDRQPDYKGKIQLDGIEYELAGWLRTSKAGNQFISVSLGDKVDRGNPKQYGGVNGSAAVTPPQSDVAVDDIPF